MDGIFNEHFQKEENTVFSFLKSSENWILSKIQRQYSLIILNNKKFLFDIIKKYK